MNVFGHLRIYSSLVVLAGAAALSACSVPPCNDQQMQTEIRRALGESNHMTITSMSNIATTSHSQSNAACTAHVASSTGEEADITYTMTLNGANTHFEVTRVVENVMPCNAAPIQTGIRNLIGGRSGLAVASMTNVTTVSRTATNAACTAHVAAANGAEADVGYALTVHDNNTNYAITAFTPTHGRTGGAAVPTADQSGASPPDGQ